MSDPYKRGGVRKAGEIERWQEDFYRQPSVFLTFNERGELVGAYGSMESARLELAVFPEHSIREEYIHNLDLALRRWKR